MEKPPLKTYDDAEAFLLGMINYEHLLGTKSTVTYDTKSFDLIRFREQLAGLGNPHGSYGVIHVAGTKGKGSTCAFLERALRAAGLKTGLYSSPHMRKFTERIRINGEPISDENFAGLLDEMRNVFQKNDTRVSENNKNFRTVFEILTASAFEWFRREKVDVAIIETGLGGRLDSTNSFQDFSPDHPHPVVQVITTLGLDHTAILGDTIQAIAAEKAGIFTRGGVSVLGFQQPSYRQDVLTVLQHILMAKGQYAVTDMAVSSVIKEEENEVHIQLSAPESLDDETKNTKGVLADILEKGIAVQPGLAGKHQAGNAATALAALAAFEAHPAFSRWQGRQKWNRGFTTDSVRAGIAKTSWFGRFQELEGEPPIVLDGAHCPLSAKAFAETLNSRFAGKPVIALCSFMADKNAADLLKAFTQATPDIRAGFACAVPGNPRALPAEKIAEVMESSMPGVEVVPADSVEEAVALAREAAGKCGGVVAVFGSLFILIPVYDILIQ